MKKPLLFASILLTTVASAQFDQSNEPAISESRIFFLCDSNATNYDNVTGTGVTWDYSNIMGINGITKAVGVIAASSSPFASTYPTAEKAISIETAITTFFSSTAGARTSQGFVYSEPTFGDVKAVWSTDEEILYNYPMNVSDQLTDNFSGNLYYEFNSIPQNAACNGNVSAEVDGSGTLMLPGYTYSNVLRYKMIDTAFTNVVLIGDLEVIREQYEYYDLANDNLPYFIHSTITMQSPGATTPLTKLSLVLSKDQPLNWLSINEENQLSLRIYPNPTEGVISIEGDLSDANNLVVSDASGRVLLNVQSVNNGQKIDLSNLGSGMYNVTLNQNGSQKTTRVVIK